MSETGSALAINEKKGERPGGCVGIFLKLFDWNRRFAKKKSFPNKLLPLDPAQHGSKKFGVDDKLPKLRLMYNEKNGTRNVDPGQKHTMRTPTLVARLMGLDSLPAVQRDKIKKTSSAEIEVDRGGKFASDRCQVNGQHRKLDNEGSKHEAKLQKTGFSERRAVARFGAEGLQFKNVLLRSSKHHHPKFASPVKSPKRLSKRNAARLIGAATRILEPGLQARNRAKCALPYSSQKHHNPTDVLLVKAGTDQSKDQTESSTSYQYTAGLSRGLSSCVNCGNIVDILESGAYLEEQPSVSEYVCRSRSSFGLESRQRLPISSLEPEKESIFQSSPETFSAFAVQSRANVSPPAERNIDRTTLQNGGQTRWQLTNQQYTKQEISPSSVCCKQKFGVQNQGILERDRTSPRSTHFVRLSKDVPRNQSPSDQTRSRVPAKLDKCRYVLERRSTDRLYDPLSSARKRRSGNVARHDDICSFVGSTTDKQKIVNYNALGQAMARGDVPSATLTSISSNLARLGTTNQAGDTNNGIVSFTLSSSKKEKDRIPTKTNDRGYQSECRCISSSQKSSVLNDINRKRHACFQKSSLSAGDTLGVLLEQKLKKLSSQEDNEMALGCSPLKRTSAIILQELISALSVERSLHVNDAIVKPTEIGVSSCCEHTLSAHPYFQARQNKEAQVRHSNKSNNDISKGRPGIERMPDFVNRISDVLCSMDLVDSRLKGSKLAHAEEVILNVELEFGNTFRQNSNETKGFSICQFMVNELETLGSVLWTDFGCFSASEDTEGNLLKGFLFDCVIEYLDSRYNPSIKGRIKTWTDLPVPINTEMLIREVVEEIRRWTSWAGFGVDELIERGMSNWTDFDVEAFETSVAVDEDILDSLLDEIVIDLWQSKLNLCVA